MLNRTYIGQPAVNVHIQQQPNDSADAARLYGECKAKAEKEVADATIVKFGAHNEMIGVKIDSQRTFHDEKVHVRLLFSINGDNFDIQVEDTYEGMTRGAYQEVASKLFDKVMRKMLPSSFST
jgi:hypothetical protein